MNDKQAQILDNLSKYIPAFRNFTSELGSVGFGTGLQTTEQSVSTLQSDVEEIQEASVSTVVELEASSSREQNVVIVPAGKGVTLLSVQVNSVAFNEFAQLSIGSDENLELLLAEDEVDLSIGGTYVSNPPIVFSNDTQIKAFFEAGGSAAGSALIRLTYG